MQFWTQTTQTGHRNCATSP